MTTTTTPAPLVVISSYPEQGVVHSAHTVGVASYTKNLLTQMSQLQPNTPIVVLAEKLDAVAETEYTEGSIRVIRCWQRGKPTSFHQLHHWLKKLTATKVLVSFEINMFGSRLDTWHALHTLRTARKKLHAQVTFTLHQVMGDFADLEPNPLKRSILNFGARYFYQLVGSASDQIIVFEQGLKDTLALATPTLVIPHYISPEPIVPQESARATLNWSDDEIYVLYFGYLAPYKGILELLQHWPQEAPKVAGKKVNLIVGGGINPNHQTKPEIVTYVKAVEKKADELGVKVTGFIKDTDLPTYLSACDLMIFPYRSFLSSSGPLAMAFSYHKLPLLSGSLAKYGASADFGANLAKHELKIDDLVFSLTNGEGLVTTMERVWQKQASVKAFGEDMLESRALPQIAAKTWQAVETPL